MKQIIFLIIFLPVTLTGCFNNISEGSIQETIKIGFIGPLTGNAASFGIVEQRVTELIVHDWNEKGGINGRNVEVIYEDGKCDGKEAVLAAQKLIHVDKVNFILSTCSAETLSIAPITENEKMILFSSYSTNPDISFAGDFVFRTAYSDEDIARIAAEFLSKRHTSVGILTELSGFSVGLRDALQDYAEQKGLEIYEENYERDQKDVKAEVTKILTQKPDAIFINPDSPNSGLIALRQLDELGYRGEVYGNFFGGSTDVIASQEADGIIFFADPVVSQTDVQEKLFQTYLKTYGEEPQFSYPAASRHDALQLLKQAIKNVGTNSENIRDYFYNLESFNGTLGTYRFDENGDIIGVYPAIKQVRNGKSIIYT